MLARREDPIVAIATASGRGAVGIVRVSGVGLEALVRAVCGRRLEPRHATYVPFLDGDGSVIDRGIAIFFAAPHSSTGEDVLELQSHGGAVVPQLLLARCLAAAAEAAPASSEVGPGTARLPNLRIARAGEFTERAFLNDKLDLAQAEAVADLIDAGTEAAARAASRSLDGAFSAEIDALGAEVVDLRMLVEATLDFPEEEEEFLERADARGRLAAIGRGIDAALAAARRGALLRDGLRVVIAGQPNVGKSSLLNALAGAELAIVTPIPGTTRDTVGATIQIEGVPIHVVDTAGLREGADEVERIGIGRAWDAIGDADVTLFLHDLTRVGQPAYDAADGLIAGRIASAFVATAAGAAAAAPGRPPGPARLLHVFNKVDLAAAAPPGMAVSASTGEGLAGLRQALLHAAGADGSAETVSTARARHVDALQRSRAHVDAAVEHAAHGDAVLELVAEELRLGHEALAEITGGFTSDDLLGAIFGRFCIGK